MTKPSGLCINQNGCPGWTCGTLSTYGNAGCRGDACRAANATYNQAARLRRGAALDAGTVSPEHGKESTYLNYMCRCRPCKDAHNVAEGARNRNRARVSVETMT